MVFYDTFETLCRKKKIAPSALTKALGMSTSAPGRWRTGSLPDLETAQRLADYFGVSIDYLVYGEEKYGSMSGSASNGSAVIQGGHGNHVTASNQVGSSKEEAQGFEGELLSIYRELDLSDKLALLQHALELKKRAGE